MFHINTLHEYKCIHKQTLSYDVVDIEKQLS